MAPIERWLADAARHRAERGRPLVTLSYAQSLDGSISRARGAPTAISGPESLAVAHRLRGLHDAVLVGIGTVLADDPQLNVRLASGHDPQPIVVDSRLRTPPDAKLLAKEPFPWLFCLNSADTQARARLERAGARIFPQKAERQVDLPALLDQLGEMGVNSLMMEGGARIITSFLKADLADQVAITLAPRYLGGLNAVDGPLGDADASLPVLVDVEIEPAGRDFILYGRLKQAAA